MATTGTYVYDITGAGIISQALRILGVIEEGGTASATQLSDALPAFEMYVKGMAKHGLHLWTKATQSVTLTESVCSYAFTNKFTKITNIVFRDNDGFDTTMIPLTEKEYWNLNDKDEESTQPTQYYYDVQEDVTTSLLYIWPCPDATAAAGGTLQVRGTLYLEDVDGGDLDASETIDVPQEWLETICYGLATRLARPYGYPTGEYSLLLKEYMMMLEESLNWDTEQEAIYLRPDYSREIA